MTLHFQLKRLLAVIGLSTIGLWLLIGAAVSTPARSLLAHSEVQASVTGVFTTYLPLVSRNWDVASYPNCRLGVGLGGSASAYNVSALNLGWYLDWRTALTPARPNGVEYAQVVRIQSEIGGGFTFAPPTATLQAIAAANPGAIWLIGNEPDSPAQDNLTPELYARAYHHLYQLIKTADPSARLGAGSIVQPTPLRFQYLDRVVAAYQADYSQTLPADLWNIHSYILREITSDDPESMDNGGPYEVWGAYVPPGITATRGELYTYSQMFDLNIFRQRLIDFRTWMANNGYADVPLIITEYGTLFPYPPYIDGDPYVDENGIPMDEARTANFLTQSFDALRMLTNTLTGYAADGQHLVQRWAWYSIDDATYGGILYYTNTRTLNALGATYAAYARQLPRTVDVNVRAQSQSAPWAGQPITVTLVAVIGNQGNVAAPTPIKVVFADNPAGSGQPIGSVEIPENTLSGCGGSIVVTTTWLLSTPGTHPFYVRADLTNGVSDPDHTNNVSQGAVTLTGGLTQLLASRHR